MKLDSLRFFKNTKIIRTVALGVTMSFLVLGLQGAIVSAKSSEELKGQKSEADQAKTELEEAGRQLKKELGDVNSELYDISMDINDIENEIEELEDKISLAKEQLDLAEAEADTQYESMKKRIQFMYENDGGFSWTILFEAESFTDFINKANYMKNVTAKDRDMLEEYRENQLSIASYKAELEADHEELLTKEAELEKGQSALLAKVASIKQQVSDNESEVAAADAKASKLAAKIKAMEAYERKLDAAREKKEKEQPATSSATTTDSDESVSNDGSEDSSATDNTSPASNQNTDNAASVGEAELLAALIYCEAGGESYEAQVAVGSVVINRRNSGRYPNTIAGVIYQAGQFSPAASGKLALVLEHNLTTESCRNAANTVLAGNLSGDWLFFKFNDGKTEGTVINKQVFY